MNRPGKKGITLGVLIGLSLLFGIVVWYRGGQPSEPVYEGQPLSYWVLSLYDSARAPEARKALRALGPKAAQYFFDSIDADPGDTIVRRAYKRLWTRLPARLKRRAPKPAVPLRTRMHDIAGHLTLIGQEAGQTILEACRHSDPNVRYTAVLATPYIGRWREDAVPVLAELLADPSADVREKAIASLERIEANKAPALAGLLRVLTSDPISLPDQSLTQVARVLGEIGPAAQEAAPPLNAWLNHSNPALRVETALALWKIDHDPEARDLLIAQIRTPASKKDVLWTLIPSLGQMGTEAKAFVPALRERLEACVTDTNSPPGFQPRFR